MTQVKEAPEADAQAEGEEDENKFPRMVFREGKTTRIWNGETVDFLVVGNQTALDAALDHGWTEDPADVALAPKMVEEAPYTPRPHEPDNAPFQNTPYVESQTGELPERFHAEPDPPIVQPIPPEDEPGPEAEADTLEAEEGEEATAKRGRPRKS